MVNIIDKKRNTGIELLKVIAIFLIVISHVTQTLGEQNVIVQLTNPIIQGVAKSDFSEVVTIFFRHLGGIGNTIFIVCSAYFLLNSKEVKKEKVVKMVLINFSVSVIILMITLLLGFNISIKNILTSFFPTLKTLNWFVTCYILFYMIHGYLNNIIENCSKKKHLAICMFLITFYYILNIAFFANNFFYTKICDFITIYFIVAYLKRYCKNFMCSNKINILLVTIGILVLITNHFLSNYIGLKIEFFSNKVMLISGDVRIYNLFIGIGLLNLFKKIDLQSKIVKNLSSLSLLIYIIHDNIFVRGIFRPIVWNYIYNITNYKYLVVTTIIYAIILFAISALFAYIYNKIFQNILDSITNKIIIFSKKVFEKIYNISNKLLN